MLKRLFLLIVITLVYSLSLNISASRVLAPTLTLTPKTPTGITVPATSNNGSFTLTWLSSVGLLTTSGLYFIEQSFNGMSYQSIASVNSATLSYLFKYKSAGTFRFRIKACNPDSKAVGGYICSGWGYSGNVVVGSVLAAPATPTGPSAVNISSFTISWIKPSGTVNYYSLQERLNSGTWTTIVSSTTSTSKTLSNKTSGGWAYRVRACNSYGCSSYSGIKEVTVNIPVSALGLTGIPNAAIITNNIPGSKLVGEIKGQTTVDGGAFNYSVPIQIAPGRAGMQPSISLNYSSQSGGGIAGYGWSLSAAGSISRCSSIFDLDNVAKSASFAIDDKLCLNGSRLIAKSGGYGLSGTTYTTERNGQSTVKQYGGINGASTYFIVTEANGHTSTFGYNGNSRLLLSGLTITTSWLLESQQDNARNQIHYVYDQGVGTKNIQDIYYTGKDGVHGDRKVHFNYSAIEDTTSYHWGGKSIHNQQLANIDIIIKNNLEARWILTHQASTSSPQDKLTSLKYCDGNALASCLETSFAWFDKQLNFTEQTTLTHHQALDDDNCINNVNCVTIGNEGRFKAGFRVKREYDYDGDGIADLTRGPDIYLSKNNSTFSSLNLPEFSYLNYPPDEDFSEGSRIVGANEISSNFIVGHMDYNSDGRADFVYINHSNQLVITGIINGIPQIIKRTGIDATCYGLSTTEGTYQCHSKVLDFNGDGRADLLVASRVTLGSNETKVTYKAYLNNGVNFNLVGEFDAPLSESLSPMDLDGDGLQDMVPGNFNSSFFWYKTTYNPATSAISFVKKAVTFNLNATQRDKPGQWADFNGDGLQDALTFHLANSGHNSYTWYIAFNKGNGLFTTPVSTGRRELAWGTSNGTDGIVGDFPVGLNYEPGRVYNQHIRFFDYNGDGRQDILVPDNSRKKYTYNCWDKATNQTCRAVDDAPFPMFHDFDVWYWKVLITQPDGISFEEIDLNVYGALSTMSIVDFNGNGLDDFVTGLGYESEAIKRQWWYSGNKAPRTQQPVGFYAFTRDGASISDSTYDDEYAISSISTGYGKKIEVEYDILKEVRPDNFVQAFDTTYPYINFSNTMRVVSVFKSDNGIGGLNTSEYRYGNARLHIAGRGFQGFGSIEETNLASGIHSTTNYYQNFPWSGMVESTSTVDINSGLALSHYQVENKYPSASEYVVGESFCFYPTKTTTTQSFHNASGGLINAAGSIATVTNLTTKNDSCQVTTNAVTRNDDTMTHTQSTVQTYQVSGFTSLPLKTTHTSSVTYKVGALVAVNPISKAVNTTKLINYQSSSPFNHQYMVNNIVVSGTDAVGNTTSFEYDEYGNATKITTGDSTQTRWTASLMDNDGYFVNKTYNSQWGMAVPVTTNEYHALTGSLLSATDQHGITSGNTINFLGAVQTAYTLDGAANRVGPTAYSIYEWDNVQVIQDGAPVATKYIDTLGRTIRETVQGFNGSLVTSETEYNALGQVVSLTAPTADYGTMQTTLFGQYDALGRPASKTFNDGHVSYVSTYSYSGLTTDIDVYSADNSVSMSRSYNSASQLMRTKDAKGQFSYFAYNAADLPVLMRDVLGNDITAVYDSLGRKSSVSDPNMGNSSFTYNTFGELIKQTDANNHISITQYDALGRVTNRDGRRWIYDGSVGNGRLNYNYYDGKTETYSYDTLGRVNQINTQIDTETFVHKMAYDAYYGRVKGEQFASGEVVAYRYNPRGYLTSEAKLYSDGSSHTYREITAMSAQGQVATQRFGNGLIQKFKRHNSGVVEQICTGVSESCHLTGLQQHNYLYDSMGNLSEQSDTAINFVENYHYDMLNRIDYSQHSDRGVLKTVNYDFDAAGNLLNKSDYANNYVYGNKTKSAGGKAGPNAVRQLMRKDTQAIVSFIYDNNGNLKQGDGLTLDYNSDNKPTQITHNGTSTQFNYGADGMRYKQVTNAAGTTTTTYYGKQFERVKQVTAGATTEIMDKTFVGGHTILFKTVQGSSGSQKPIVHTLQDRLGGVDTLVDGSRTLSQVGAQENLLLQRRGYDLFGRPRYVESATFDFSLNTTANLLQDWKNIKQGFTGHEHLPESELIHMNGRVYDYNMGRFLSVDPFVQSPTNSQSVNPYSYIMNNPMAGVDPTGYKAEEEDITGMQIDSAYSDGKDIYVTSGDSTYKIANISNGQKNANLGIVAKNFNTKKNKLDSKDKGKDVTGTNQGSLGSRDGDGLPGKPEVRFFVSPDEDKGGVGNGKKSEKEIAELRQKTADLALSKEGDESYSYDSKKGRFPKESWKCNKFVYDILKEAGIDVPLNPGGDWPLQANGWANKNYKIPGWEIVDTPMPGDVAAIPRNGTGHVGIYVKDRWGSDVMAANKGGVGWSKSHLSNDWLNSAANASGDTVYRRYVGKN